MIEAAMLSAVALAVGAGLVWFIYGAHLMEYHRADDNHGFNVSLVAMFGTFMPVIFCAALPWLVF